jgi:hypothetical protein
MRLSFLLTTTPVAAVVAFAACTGGAPAASSTADRVTGPPDRPSGIARGRRSVRPDATSPDLQSVQPAESPPACAGTSADELDRVVSGHVVDARGSPVAAAKVVLVACSLPRDIVLALSDIEIGEDVGLSYPHEESEAVTDAAGAFAVRCRGDGERTLRVQFDGATVAIVDEPSNDCVVRLPGAPPALAVHVVRAVDGTPVVGARVTVAQAELAALRREWFGVGGWSSSATTDADGRCRVGDRLAAGRALVTVEADGFAGWLQDAVDVPDGGRSMDVSLSEGIVVEGRVVDDETGAAISGAQVDGAVTSDGAGRFRVEHFVGDRIRACTIGHWDWETVDSLAGESPIPARDDIASGVTIRLVRPAELVVRCVEPSGTVVPGAIVALSSGRAVESDSRGRASIRGAGLVRDGGIATVRFYVDGVPVLEHSYPPLRAGEQRDLGDVVLPVAPRAK